MATFTLIYKKYQFDANKQTLLLFISRKIINNLIESLMAQFLTYLLFLKLISTYLHLIILLKTLNIARVTFRQ